jgi:hypothetical protein
MCLLYAYLSFDAFAALPGMNMSATAIWRRAQGICQRWLNVMNHASVTDMAIARVNKDGNRPGR